MKNEGSVKSDAFTVAELRREQLDAAKAAAAAAAARQTQLATVGAHGW